MKGFNGFPGGKLRATRVPNQFFSDLLPHIDHLPELKLTLYCFWRLYRMEGAIRFVRRSEVEADEAFMAGLASRPSQAREVLADALERATARGTLLHVPLEDGGGVPDGLYFMNTPRGRAAAQSLEGGEWHPGDASHAPFGLSIERPNIFTLYEQNVGPLTPLVADQLRDIEETYPAGWFDEAVKIAVSQNKRSLAYVSAILERWQAEGKQGEKHRGDNQQDWRRFIEEEFADFIEY